MVRSEDLEVDRREGGARGGRIREVAERQLPLAQRGMVQEPAPRRLVARGHVGVAPCQAVHECGKVETSVASNFDVQIETIDLHVSECPRPAKQTRQLEVDQQAAECDDRLAGRVFEAEVLRLQREPERVDANIPNGRLASELILRVPGQMTLEQIGRQIEAR